jgi:hypothetical protein
MEDAITYIELSYISDEEKGSTAILFTSDRWELGQSTLVKKGNYDQDWLYNHNLDFAGRGGALTSLFVPENLIVSLFRQDFYTDNTGPALLNDEETPKLYFDLFNSANKTERDFNDQTKSLQV